MKKVLSIILSLVMILSMIPLGIITASADGSVPASLVGTTWTASMELNSAEFQAYTDLEMEIGENSAYVYYGDFGVQSVCGGDYEYADSGDGWIKFAYPGTYYWVSVNYNENSITANLIEGEYYSMSCDVTGLAHDHSFASGWSYDRVGHWHACTADDCDIEDYATCGLEGAAYGAHTWENGKCTCCHYICPHTKYENYKCTACGAAQFVSVAYLDEHGESKTADCTLINPAMTEWSGWMAVDGTVTIDGNVTMTADTCLILKDGATLNVNGQISGNKKLTVYVQSNGKNTGKLNVEYKATANNDRIIYGNLTVNGGIISIKTTPDSQRSICGIFGSLTVNGGDVTMYIKSDSDGSALISTSGSCENGLKVTGGSLTMTGESSQTLKGVYASTLCAGDAVYVSGGTVTITLTTSDDAIGVNNANSKINALYVTGGEVNIAIESNKTKSYAIYQNGTKNAITLIDGTINLNKTGDTKNIIYSKNNVNVSAPKVEWSDDGETYKVWDTISSLKSYNHLRLTNPPQAYLVEGHEPTVTESGLYNARIVADDGETKVIKTEKVYETDKSVTFEQWYLRTMIQYQAGEGGALDIRFASMLDENLDQYKEAGFIVEIDGQATPITLKTTEAVQSFVADDKTYNIGDFSEADDYFFLQNTVFAASLVKSRADVKVTPFVTLMDGTTTLKGAEVTFNLGTIADIAGIKFLPD